MSFTLLLPAARPQSLFARSCR